MSQHKDCPCCTCGLTEYEWSDRKAWVNENDVDALTDLVLNCALDHSYDRGSGVPYGFSWEQRDALLPVVEKHLSAINPDWVNVTITVNAAQRAAFMADVRAAFVTLREKPDDERT